MTATDTQSAVTRKTIELCEAILSEAEFVTVRTSINAFLDNDDARAQYDALNLKGQMLQQKQQMGLPLSDEEIADFNQQRDALMSNEVIKSFLDAQQEVSRVQDQVMRYVTKTFELGRLPQAEDMDDGSCCNSGGCGCSH